MKNKKLQIIILLLAVCWIGFTASFVKIGDEADIFVPKEGFLAPEFSLVDLSGNEISLAQFRGQVVLLNLWASWCKPCQAEMPALESVYQKFRTQGFTVLAVNITAQDHEESVREFVEQSGISFPVLLDDDSEVEDMYAMRAFPTTYFIDRDGIIQSVVIGGPMPESLIYSKISDLLEEE